MFPNTRTEQIDLGKFIDKVGGKTYRVIKTIERPVSRPIDGSREVVHAGGHISYVTSCGLDLMPVQTADESEFKFVIGNGLIYRQ